MERNIRNKKIDSTKLLLKLQLERIIELLETDSNALMSEGWGRDNLSKIRSELKNKMRECRRDMIRLQKLMYGYSVED